MRSLLAVLVSLWLAAPLSADERVRLTVTFREFSTEDETKGRWWSEHLDLPQSAKAALNVLQKHERAILHESLASVVKLDALFECSQSQGNRTFKVSGTVSRDKGDRFDVEYRPEYAEHMPHPKIPNATYESRSQIWDFTVTMKSGESFVQSAGVQIRKSSDRTTYIIRMVETHIETAEN